MSSQVPSPAGDSATLHDSLMARLDRLATVKGMAQLGATLGREFSYELLQAVSPWDEGTLQQGLHQLVEAEFLYQRGVPPQATYIFKHALIQDAAYQSLLRSTRQQYHQRIAQVLEAHFPETLRDATRAAGASLYGGRLIAPAIPYWQQAGQRAIERSAMWKPWASYQGLEVLQTLPDTPERTQQELALQTSSGGLRWPSPRAMRPPKWNEVYARARELCRQVGETPQLFRDAGGCGRFT